MTTISAQSIAQYAKAAMIGAPIEDVIVMVATGLCESGGHLEAENPNCPNATCYGLWQMNEGFGKRLWNPAVAASHMAGVYRISRFRYWGCGPDHAGGYAAHMDTARAAVASLSGSSGSQASERCKKNCANSLTQYGIPYETCLKECDPNYVFTSQGGTATGGGSIPAVRPDCEKTCRETYPGMGADYNECISTFCQGAINPGGTVGAQNIVSHIPGIAGVIDAANALANIAKALIWLIDPSHWARVAEFLGGVLLIIIAFYVLIGGREESAAVPALARQASTLEMAAAA